MLLISSFLFVPCTVLINRWGMVRVKKMGALLTFSSGIGLLASILLAPKNPYFPTFCMVLYSPLESIGSMPFISLRE